VFGLTNPTASQIWAQRRRHSSSAADPSIGKQKGVPQGLAVLTCVGVGFERAIIQIEQARATVVPACSRRHAVQRHLSAGSRVASTRRLATLPARWPRPRRSSDRAMTESALRCCLHISSASCGSAACDCAGRVVPSSSSRWSRRTSAGWPSSSPVRHRWPPHVWCERQLRCSRVDGVSAVASTERLVGQGSGSTPAQLASLIGDFCNKICQMRK
jgi:hypothetical protein